MDVGNRLVVESFGMLDAHVMLRTGSVPFWTVFAVERSAERLERYLDSAVPFNEIPVMVFKHGTLGAGLAYPEPWRELMARVRRRSGFLGATPDEFPLDFASLLRYHPAFERAIPAHYPCRGPLPLDAVDAFRAKTGDRPEATWDSP